jgi:hypothetical protein
MREGKTEDGKETMRKGRRKKSRKIKVKITRRTEKQKRTNRKNNVGKSRFTFMFSVYLLFNMFCVGFHGVCSVSILQKCVNFYTGNKGV